MLQPRYPAHFVAFMFHPTPTGGTHYWKSTEIPFEDNTLPLIIPYYF